jgi:hypothetical protein
MAPIAGLLIEYFIVGCVAALWALPLVITAITLNPALQKDSVVVIAATLVPALYLVGMVCDLVGQKLTHPFKEVIEAQVRKKNHEADVSSQKIHAFAVAFEPALAKQMDARSVRDRVARGSLVAVLPLLFYWPYPSTISRAFASIAGLGAIIALAMLWHRMQKLSAGYEMQVLKVLRAKYPEATRNSFPSENSKNEA